MLLVLIVVGTAAYVLVEEDWTIGEALYMVVITLSTVGFREVRTLSPAGRVVTMGLIVTGAVVLGYMAATFSRFVIEGELRRQFGRRRMEREIARLEGHYIVCGYGRVGREVCRNLRDEGVDFVVIDMDEEALVDLADDSIPYVRGDAADQDTLREAGIARARGLLLTMSREADNVYVTLLAKDLRSDVVVHSRNITEQGEQRLYAAGADRVVSPERLGARLLSQGVLRPTAVYFTEMLSARQNLDLQLEEVLVPASSVLADSSIEESNIRRNYGLIVVGVQRPDGELIFNPPPQERLQAGSTLLLLGKGADLSRFSNAL